MSTKSTHREILVVPKEKMKETTLSGQPVSASFNVVQRDNIKAAAIKPIIQTERATTSVTRSTACSLLPAISAQNVTSSEKIEVRITPSKCEVLPQRSTENMMKKENSGVLSCSSLTNMTAPVQALTATSNGTSTNRTSSLELVSEQLSRIIQPSDVLSLPRPKRAMKESTTDPDLQEQLEVQTKVNADLKKLLVASIGDDLHHKVDALVRTKVQLATEIDDYTKKLIEDYEDLDKMSIQADLWHAKYMASRVLEEKLTGDRDQLKDSLQQCQSALRHVLTERETLRQNLHHTHGYLQSLHSSFASSRHAPYSDTDVVSLAERSQLMAGNLCLSLLGSKPVIPPVLNHSTAYTAAEQQCFQVLSQCGVAVLESNRSGTRSSAVPRFHPRTRYHVTFNCCSKCKGEIKIV